MAPRTMIYTGRAFLVASSVLWTAWLAVYFTVAELRNGENLPLGFPANVSVLLGAAFLSGMCLYVGGKSLEAQAVNKALLEQVVEQVGRNDPGEPTAQIIQVRAREDFMNAVTVRNGFPPIPATIVGRAVVQVPQANRPASVARTPRRRRGGGRPADPKRPTERATVPDSVYMTDVSRAVELGRKLERENHRRDGEATA